MSSLKNCCNICCDTYNKSTRNKVACCYCDYEACRLCCETYILSETIAKCMNPSCAKEWSRKFIREKFTNVFINTKYKEHLETILYDKERALLPATQLIVEEEIRKNKIKGKIHYINRKLDEINLLKKRLEYQLHNPLTTDDNSSNKFIRSCPADDCRGFLSSQWKCGICEQWTCHQCHELKGRDKDCEHTCNPNSVETVKLLAKDTKPCPKCQSQIFKVNGCDQIWCTQCHTAFSWKTGSIEVNIHNPHYYEWQRKNGTLERAIGDIECGRQLDNNTSNIIIQLIKNKHTGLTYNGPRTSDINSIYAKNEIIYLPIVIELIDIIRFTLHNSYVELPAFQTDYVLKNQALRVKFLKNEITEEQFKHTIQVNDKKNKKTTELAQVIQLSITAVTDIVYRIIYDLKNSPPNQHNFETIMLEFNGIISYCNDIFKEIAFTYNSTLSYEFHEVFQFIHIKK